jgi:CubicO group peptidase (beta-lactamase class C family)
MAALAALRLVREKKVNLGDDINALCSSWKLPPNKFTLKQKVTLERVLSHHGGISVSYFPGYARSDPLPSLREILNGTKPAATTRVRVVTEPGKKYIHSAGGYTLLEQTLMDITGKSFPDLVDDAVFKPLRMSSSFYGVPGKKYKGRVAAGHNRDGSMVQDKFRLYPELAAAGLWTTPTDWQLRASPTKYWTQTWQLKW